MGKAKAIDLSFPCQEEWFDMPDEAGGKLCGVCERVIVDFTKMSTPEIAAYISGRNEKVCGKYRPEQVTINGRRESSFWDKFRLNTISVFGIIAAKIFTPLDGKAQDSTDLSKREPDDLKLQTQKKLYGDSTVFHFEGVVKKWGKRSPIAYANVKALVNGKKVASVAADQDGKFKIDVLCAHGGEKIELVVARRKYKDIIVPVIADGQTVVIKMKKSWKRRYRRHYTMGF